MTTIYVPRLIESAEQAEALPEGTVARNESASPGGSWYSPPRIKIRHDMWAGDDLYRSADMVGWTALVPIEAEEKYGAEMKWDAGATHDTHVSLGLSLDNARWQVENNPDYATGRIMRQYRTPWEEA